MNINKLSVHQISSKDLLLYTFITPRHCAKDFNPNRTFYTVFRQALKDVEALNGFLIICEKLICKWQQGQFQLVRDPIGIYEGPQIARATKRQERCQ